MRLFKKVAVYTISRKTLGKAFNVACRSRLSRMFIKPYIRLYKIDRKEIRHPSAYKSLTDFFVRDIDPGLRPIANGRNIIVSPVDGTIADLGFAQGKKIILAKKNFYSLAELLAFPNVDSLQDCYYMNIYLSPRNYHRIHMPFPAQVIHHQYVPGQVFPVNKLGVSTVKDLFAKNRRTCTIFETKGGAKFALIKVGALGVGKIISSYHVGEKIPKGKEIGRFEFGSTVILIFQKDLFKPSKFLTVNQQIKMGQKIGSFLE